MTDKKADIALIGLAVMGQNLVLNMADHGFTVAVFNRTVSKVDAFMNAEAKGKSILPAHSLEELISKLKKPRKIMLMIKAGDAVDAFIEKLVPLLEEGDILIDGGNSHYPDSQRRYESLKEKNIHFIGAGISGGEEGARHGPSIMPGGSPEAWDEIKPIFQSIAAKSEEGEPCCDWVGEGGAGHYVKMVHNGIEYGDMQLICEVYDLLHRAVGMNYEELQTVFQKWNQEELNSYLIEITTKILAKKDSNKEYLLDKILDVAGQKGTGKWTVIDALDLGSTLTLIAEAVFARNLSSLKEERIQTSKIIQEDLVDTKVEKDSFCKSAKQALYASKIISYAQGFALMRKASELHKWNLNYGSIALMWRGGCIIRSIFLKDIKKAFDQNPKLINLMMDDFFKKALQKAQKSWREVVIFGFQRGIALPCLASALAYFDGYRSERLPANLLQAQRDFFGAHTYERIDKPRGEFFHMDWATDQGEKSSSTYNA